MPLLTTGAGGYPAIGGGGGFTPSSSQSLAFFNRVATITGTGNPTYSLSTNERNAYDTLISGMVTDGTWTLFDALYIFATTSAASRAVALMNLVSSSFTCVEHGISGTQFSADNGYVGVAGGYLDTQLNPGAGTGKFLQNDATVFAWMRSVPAADSGAVMNDNTGSFKTRIYPYFSGQYFMGVNNSSLDSASGSGHMYTITRDPARSGSTQDFSFIDGTVNPLGAAAWSSVTPVGSTLVLLADNTSGSNNPSTGIVGAAGIGGGLTNAQQGNVYSRLNTYMASVP